MQSIQKCLILSIAIYELIIELALRGPQQVGKISLRVGLRWHINPIQYGI